MKSARRFLYAIPVAVSLTIVGASVFGYAWSSTLINLVCSIQDDSFYYFVPSWNAAHGLGFTFGGEKTSGWQPLYELLLTAFSYFCHSLESVMRVAIHLNGWLFALTGAAIGLAFVPLIRTTFPKLPQPAAALSVSVAVLSFVCLHTVFFSSVTGKENALAALLLAFVIWGVFSPGGGGGRSVFVGLLCGLLLLTRIAPSSLVYASIAIFMMQGRQRRLVALAACAAPMIVWGVFAHEYFGHVLPMSMLVKMSAPNHLSAVQEAKSGLKYLWESTRFSLSGESRFNLLQLAARPAYRSPFQIVIMVIALATSVLGMLQLVLARTPSRAVVALIAFNAGGVICNVLFGAAQAGKSDDIYYTVWYIYDLPVLFAINCGFAIAWTQAKLNVARTRPVATAILAAACVAYFANDVVWYARLKPYSAADDRAFASSWQIKKLEVANWFRENVQPTNPHYRIVAFSAGALSFYLYDHVVNLDGLANNAAADALMTTHSVAGYTKDIRADYLIETCPGEQNFDNLERLHVIPFPKQKDYCIDRFIYRDERTGGLSGPDATQLTRPRPDDLRPIPSEARQ